jgi:hypothetical protein
MRPLELKPEHFVGEFCGRKFPSIGKIELLADLPVLAEGAAKVAAGEEDGSGAARTGNRRFFAEVQSGMREQNVAGYMAKAGFSGQAIDPAMARTAFAAVQLL